MFMSKEGGGGGGSRGRIIGVIGIEKDGHEEFEDENDECNCDGIEDDEEVEFTTLESMNEFLLVEWIGMECCICHVLCNLLMSLLLPRFLDGHQGRSSLYHCLLCLSTGRSSILAVRHQFDRFHTPSQHS
ncbi:hypothetical protein PMAYCL1PPCAC_06926, partial [Pristionchus mayeri]